VGMSTLMVTAAKDCGRFYFLIIDPPEAGNAPGFLAGRVQPPRFRFSTFFPLPSEYFSSSGSPFFPGQPSLVCLTWQYPPSPCSFTRSFLFLFEIDFFPSTQRRWYSRTDQIYYFAPPTSVTCPVIPLSFTQIIFTQVSCPPRL